MNNESMVPLIPHQSRYLRNTWMISAEKPIIFPDNSSIRYFSGFEANNLSEMIRKRNVFARHSWENNFYIQRIAQLSNHTVIEVYRDGDPRDIREEVQQVADKIEKLTLVSSTLVVRKSVLLKKLGISLKPGNELDVIIGSRTQYISSKSQRPSVTDGVNINDRFQKRFSRCGFLKLYEYCLSNNELAKRVSSSIDWLFESRREPSIYASIVKTSIALETLLIFADSENLARSLSERVAYILSPDPDTRQQLNNIIRWFYKVRSTIVHGNRKKKLPIDSSLIESVDRICVLIYLVISSNSQLWASVQEFQKWFETQRWSNLSTDIDLPFSKQYLMNALEF